MSSSTELLEEPETGSQPKPAESPVAGQECLPVTVVEPRSGWQLVNFRELWDYRQLLGFLIWRDIKVRYKQTVLGAAWAVLQPLATMVVFSLFLGRMAGVSPPDLPYPLFVLAGILPWTYFSNAISSAGQSIVGSQNLVTKVYFPRLIIPMGAVGAGLVDFAIGGGLLFILMIYYGISTGWGLLMAPVLVFALVIAALGVGTLLAALTVAYRDFRFVVPFMVQLWMFATPSIYMSVENVIDPRWQPYLCINPAEGLIINFRQAILGGALNGLALGVSLISSLVLLAVGCLYFRRVERSFADII